MFSKKAPQNKISADWHLLIKRQIDYEDFEFFVEVLDNMSFTSVSKLFALK